MLIKMLIECSASRGDMDSNNTHSTADACSVKDLTRLKRLAEIKLKNRNKSDQFLLLFL